ncbi:hypothetical protein F5144DRAFT_598848 [Chaetomium tenue]|uniref:Uncharacterized protein n=1 Tax=Chaetomium tenue TaxID=1854479 RepID=A0ACB7PF46_9PEZI|nr:hypothetical protein F5144DRAFT_598848 [Chaetomium globosum]
MQLPTLAIMLSLAAFGAAQTTAIGCTHGNCGSSGGRPAIYQCNNGQQRLVSICGNSCEYINGSPFCK